MYRNIKKHPANHCSDQQDIFSPNSHLFEMGISIIETFGEKVKDFLPTRRNPHNICMSLKEILCAKIYDDPSEVLF